jgi:CHAT domain
LKHGRKKQTAKGGFKKLAYSRERPIYVTVQLFFENVTVAGGPSDRTAEKIKILFISANPAGTTPLKLDEEAREIQAKIRDAEYRDSMEFITQWATRPGDLLQCLNQYKPHVVHFSGHGSPKEEIILLNHERKPKPVSKHALISTFRALKNNIRVVLLNACFSRPQAESITTVIDCAIGMRRAIGDDAAIIFAAAFYRAIGFGGSVQDGFDQGKAALLLEGIAEEKTPALMCRKGVKAESILLIKPRQACGFDLRGRQA